MNKAMSDIYTHSYFEVCDQKRWCYSVACKAALLHLSYCPFAVADPDTSCEQPVPCLLQTTNPEHPGATAERQNKKGAGIRPLATRYSLAQWVTQAGLAHLVASCLLPVDLVSFKCPLVAVALPGGHVPMAQLEQMKHFA